MAGLQVSGAVLCGERSDCSHASEDPHCENKLHPKMSSFPLRELESLFRSYKDTPEEQEKTTALFANVMPVSLVR